MLVLVEEPHSELRRDEPPAAEGDLRSPVFPPHEALPEAVRGGQPVRVPHEHLAEPGAADLLRALAYPQERDRRAAVVRVEPQVDRLETGRDVGLVVARPARPDRAVA